MKIKHGWSGNDESGRWNKFDVTVEECDLRSILFEEGCIVDDLAHIKSRHRFVILQAEAEILLLLKMMTAFAYPVDKGQARIAQLSELKNDAIKKIETYLPGAVDAGH